MSSSPSTPCRIEVFGGPRVRRGTELAKLSPTQLALLAVIAVEDDVERTRIAEILWRRDADTKIRHRIRQLIHAVNRRLRQRVIVTDKDRLALDAGVETDMAVLRRAFSGGPILEAAEAWLTGFGAEALSTVGGEYQDWVEHTNAELRERLWSTAERRWRDAKEAGDWARARDAAEGMCLLAPTDPQVVANVVDSRALDSTVAAAEAAFAAYTELLGKGVEPDPVTVEAIERVRILGEEQARRRPGNRNPFVGREPELALGRSVLEAVAGGEFRFLLISGESGIGKTRLMTELAKEAVLRDVRCLHASPVELERRIPLNPLLDALEPIDLGPHLHEIGAPWNIVVNATLPPGSYEDIGDEVPPIRESGLPRRLLDSYSLLLESLAADQPTVLFLDDLQWSDETTVTALQFFQRRWTHGGFAIIASIRPELVPPGSPTARYLLDDEKLDVTRITLDELSDEDAARLVREMADGKLDEPTVERLCALAGPHPLFLTELTRDHLSGRLPIPGSHGDQIQIPVSLKELLKTRMDRLSDDARAVAEALAVSSRALSIRDLASVTGTTEAVIARALDELGGDGLAALDRDAGRIAHDLFRSAVYHSLPTARRALMHRQIADRLQGLAGPDSCGELAEHYVRSGDEKQAVAFAREAASRARVAGAMSEAASYFGIVASCETSPADQALATANAGAALLLCRQVELASSTLEVAVQRLRAVGDDRLATRMEIRRVEALGSLAKTDTRGLLEQLRDVQRGAEEAGDLEAAALSLDAQLRLLDRLADASAISGVFEELTRIAQLGNRDAAVVCHAGLALQTLFGDRTAGVRSAERALQLATAGSEHRLTALVRSLAIAPYVGSVLGRKADEIVDEARYLAGGCGDKWAQASIEINRALGLLGAGEVDRANGVMLAASRLFGGGDDEDMPRFQRRVVEAEIALERGDFAASRDSYVRAASEVSPTTPAYVMDTLNAGLGLTALELGELSEARRHEGMLGPALQLWCYDPTTLIRFKSRLAELRGRRQDAICLVEEARSQIESRHAIGWLKLGLLQARLQLKAREPSDARETAQSVLAQALRLGLPARAAEARALTKVACDSS